MAIRHKRLKLDQRKIDRVRRVLATKTASCACYGADAPDQLIRAHVATHRPVAPSPGVFDDAGLVLRALRMAGREVRRASLVNDVLIALTARAMGATLYTANAGDFEAIRRVRQFALQVAPTS